MRGGIAPAYQGTSPAKTFRLASASALSSAVFSRAASRMTLVRVSNDDASLRLVSRTGDSERERKRRALAPSSREVSSATRLSHGGFASRGSRRRAGSAEGRASEEDARRRRGEAGGEKANPRAAGGRPQLLAAFGPATSRAFFMRLFPRASSSSSSSSAKRDTLRLASRASFSVSRAIASRASRARAASSRTRSAADLTSKPSSATRRRLRSTSSTSRAMRSRLRSSGAAARRAQSSTARARLSCASDFCWTSAASSASTASARSVRSAATACRDATAAWVSARRAFVPSPAVPTDVGFVSSTRRADARPSDVLVGRPTRVLSSDARGRSRASSAAAAAPGRRPSPRASPEGPA